MKKALIISTVVGFITSFEQSDITILQEMGYEVHCATNTSRIVKQEVLDQLLNNGLILHHIEFNRSPYSAKNILAYKELKKLMEKEKFYLVHCHTPVGGVLARLAAHSVGVSKVIYTSHGFHFWEGAPIINWLIFYNIEKFLSKWTDILITINKYDYNLAKDNFYMKKIYKINGVGINLNKFKMENINRDELRKELRIDNQTVLLLSVGELTKDKNHIVILDAIKKLKDKTNKKIMYMIAGRGPKEKELLLYADKLGIKNNFCLLGYRNDVPSLLQACDVFVFPSIMEGLPVALMEAVAAKKAVVCSRARGNTDLIVTDSSFFDFKDIDDIVNCILYAINQNNKKLVDINFNNLKNFDICCVQKQMKNIYIEVTK